MLSPKMEAALNHQINAEYFSSYLYLSMASYAESLNLTGFGNWFRMQAAEEMIHMHKFFDYVLERGGRVKLTAIEAPETDWESPLAVFEQTLEHEQLVTSLINKLVDLAIAESDHATNNVLQWFIAEQVEEEASADGVVQQLKLMADAPGGLFMLDRELGGRAAPKPPVG
jgi:ferritin